MPITRQRSASLRAKLGTGFAVVTLLMLILGLFALSRLRTLDTSVAEMRDDYMPSAYQIASMSAAMQNVRRLEAGVLLAGTVEQRRVLLTELKAGLLLADRARADYEPLIDAGSERDRYAAVIDPAWAGLKADDGALLAMIAANDLPGAHALFMTRGLADFDALMSALHWDIAYNRSAGVAAGARSRVLYRQIMLSTVLGLLLVVSLSAAVAIGLTRHITGPLAAITGAMRRLAARDLGVSVPHGQRGDEIGAMAAAVEIFKANMVTADRIEAERVAERAARQERGVRIETLVGDFERKIGGTVSMLAAASTEMEATASSMTENAAQTDRQAIAVAQAAEQSSGGVQTVAAASEQLASSITEINRQVTSSLTLTNRAVGSVRRTDETVRTLSDRADRIGDIVGLITSIASQTNLLALNATIEAARAGDAGKGFAVVASEVKNLAQQTARATEDIATQVGQVQQASQGAVEAIREIGGLIEEVGATTTLIAAAVEQQGAATAEIARNVQQTAASTRVVTSNISGVSRAANDTGAAASQVLSAAGDLSRQAESLSMEVSQFIDLVASA